MKVDLSTLLLVVIAIIPGLFAQRSRNLLVPRSFSTKGASEELAELVALGLATHGVIAFLIALLLSALGILHFGKPAYYFQEVDGWQIGQWVSAHRSEVSLICAAYVFVSFLVSHCLGLVYGGVGLDGGLTAKVLKRAQWLSRFGIRGFLGERPIIYELLDAQVDGTGESKTVFVEAEMKDGLGFYSGQLSQFAIVRDEEPHRPIYLVEPWYKGSRTDDYTQVQADGILIDLADVACLLIKQTDC